MTLTIPTQILTQTCTIEPAAGTHGDGTPTYGPPATAACRFEVTARTVKDATGKATTRYGPLFLGPDTAVAVGDRVTIAGRPYLVAQVDTLQGLAGPTHLEVELT